MVQPYLFSAMTKRVEVIIAGAGIAGASLAYELSQSREVLLIEREERPGMHATGRSAAIFSEIYGNSIVRSLSRASRRFLFSPPAGFAQAPLVRPRGTLFIAPAEQVATLRSMREDRDVFAGTETISPLDALQRVPILRPNYVCEALYEPGACDIDVDALHQGFLRGFKLRGGQLLCAAITRSIQRARDMWLVETNEGTFGAKVLVNAAGAWADEFAALSGVPAISIEPKRRTVVLVEGPRESDFGKWPLTIDAAETFYFKPDSGRLLVTPADETPTAPCDAQPDELDVAIAIDRLETVTTMRVKRVAHKWAGLRSFAPDRTPVAGFDPAIPEFFWLVGQGGYGMQTSSAMARVAASLICGGDLPGDLLAEGVTAAALSPARLRLQM